MIIGVYFLASSILFFLYSYNSGYGYDALEYLIIGRSILDGYPLFYFLTSKSWGLYYVVAFFLSFLPHDHTGVSFMITAVYSAFSITTYFIVKKVFNLRTAILSHLLITLCALTMELNFLEPEGLVYLCGLLGFWYVLKALNNQRIIFWFISGLCFGLGCAFKVVAGFYFLGALNFLLLWYWFREKIGVLGLSKNALSLSAGFFLALLAPLLYFVIAKKGIDFLFWTYYFPVFNYPSHTVWFVKLLKKLFWFHAIFITALIISTRGGVRRSVYGSPSIWLIISLSLFAIIPLLKTQATHYFFPSAAFLSVFFSRIADIFLSVYCCLKNAQSYVVLGSLTSLALAGSHFLYPSDAFRRLAPLKNYSFEEELKMSIQSMVPKSKKALFFSHEMYLYWISERYPNVPFVAYVDQTAYFLQKNKNIILTSLKDPDLFLVESSPENSFNSDVGFSKFMEKDNNTYFDLNKNLFA